MNLLVTHDRADVGALCLNRRSIRQHRHFLGSAARLKRDIESCNRIDLNLHSLLYGRLEALRLDGHVVTADCNVGDAINSLCSGCCLVNISGVDASYGDRRTAHDRT